MQSQAVLNNKMDKLVDSLFIRKDTLSETDKQKLIYYCFNHIDNLEKIVIDLIKTYRVLVIKEVDHSLMDKTTQLDLAIKALKSQIDSIQDEINQLEKVMTDNAGSYNIYLYWYQIEQLKKSQIDIQKLADQLKEQFHQLQYRAENLGLSTIIEHISFCLNMLLEHAPTNYSDNTIKSYLNIAKILAEFWYEEAPTWSAATVDHPTYDNLYALVLFSMSRVDDHLPVLERACYLQILDEKLGLMETQKLMPSKFELSSYCEQYPENFIKLHSYLFEGEHVFIESMNELASQNHAYVKYTFAIFYLYLSRAYQVLSQHEHAEVNREKAKKILWELARSSHAIAIEALEKYYANEIKIIVTLATYYLIQEDTRGLIFSDKAYKQLRECNVMEKHSELDQEFMDQLIQLTDLWIKNPNMVDKKHYALQLLKGCVQTDKTDNGPAYQLLRYRAHSDLDCAIAFSQVLISMYDIGKVTVDKMIQEGDIFRRHANKNGPEADFQFYLVYKIAQLWSNGMELLFNAAKEKYEPAIAELQKLVAEGHPAIPYYRIAIFYLNEIDMIDHIEPVIRYLSLDKKFEVQLKLAKMVVDDDSIHFKKYNPAYGLLKLIYDLDSVASFACYPYEGMEWLIDKSEAIQMVLDELEHLAKTKNDFQFSAAVTLVNQYCVRGENRNVLKFLSICCQLDPLKTIDNTFDIMSRPDIVIRLKSDILFSVYSHLQQNNNYKAQAEYIGNELMRRDDKRMVAFEPKEHSHPLSQADLTVIRPSIVKSTATFFQNLTNDYSAIHLREKKMLMRVQIMRETNNENGRLDNDMLCQLLKQVETAQTQAELSEIERRLNPPQYRM
jgi:hypothetical protein